MEKNTKILLGVAAVVVAYLVLKPKKAAGAESKTTSDGNTTDRFICPEGYEKKIKVVGGVVGILHICKDANGNETQQFENPNFIDTESQFICPKGSYNRGRLTPNVPDESCSDGSTATKNPNYGKTNSLEIPQIQPQPEKKTDYQSALFLLANTDLFGGEKWTSNPKVIEKASMTGTGGFFTTEKQKVNY